MKFKIETLGCRSNQYESEVYFDQLLQAGFVPASRGEKAGLCIINTCTVTSSADSNSRHKIRQIARQNRDAKIVITGCLKEVDFPEIENLIIVPNADKERLLSIVFPEMSFAKFAAKTFGKNTRAFVKVQDGCNSFCSYCIIPYVRGRSRSRPVCEIVEEVEGLVKNGKKEIVLTGINVGDFSPSLADLMKKLDSIDGLIRLRLSSIGPESIDDKLIDVLLHGKTICPSLHLSLQSGSNEILNKMGRKYTREKFLEKVEILRAGNPDFNFTTDVIVGFPGETEEDFEDTIDILKRVRFSKVHIFPYSVRKGTRAERLKERVPAEVVNLRKKKLLDISEKLALEFRQSFVGRKMRVLTEGDGSRGYTDNFLEVRLPKGDNLCANTLVDVKIL